VDARFFVHVPQIERGSAPESYVEKHMVAFLASTWPFGDPVPHIDYDKRALVAGPPYSSLHAKCVVVDGTKAFISSANFTQRAQERNIEVGVLIEDPNFGSYLAGQWLGLIESGLVAEYPRSQSHSA
jgi:phosphatidylserine/phosphatidylglycerophosphate/cardiolipin synthase-like enzyme